MNFMAFDIETPLIVDGVIPDMFYCGCIADESGSACVKSDILGNHLLGGAAVLLGRIDVATRVGVIPVTWNGARFDFQVIANSRMRGGETPDFAKMLCRNHIDLMLNIVYYHDKRPKLQSALIGSGMEPKQSSGDKVQALWESGQQGVVIDYNIHETQQLFALANYAKENGYITCRYHGKINNYYLWDGLLTVQEIMDLAGDRLDRYYGWLK